jgi:hypothetical protein
MGLASDWNGRTLPAKHPQKTGEKYNQKSPTRLLAKSFKSAKTKIRSARIDDPKILSANPSTPALAIFIGPAEPH